MRPATMMEVTTGVSSRDSASASTPPTDLVRPSFANSLQQGGRWRHRGAVRLKVVVLNLVSPSFANSLHTRGKGEEQLAAESALGWGSEPQLRKLPAGEQDAQGAKQRSES